MDELTPVQALRRLGGHATWAELSRYVGQSEVRTAVAGGEILRPSRGVYTLPELPSAARAVAVSRGVLSHESAARFWQLSTLLEPEQVHVTVPRGARPVNAAKIRVHRSALADHDVHERVTSPLRTVLDCAASLPFAEGLAIADSALQRELLDHDELIAQAQRAGGRGRQAKLAVATHADGRAANAFESGLRAIVIEAGLTGFEPQVPITTPRLKARVDLADVGRRIVLEADSFAFHGTRTALERDCRRYDELTLAGWLVLRFAWEHVMFEAGWVREVVREACALRR